MRFAVQGTCEHMTGACGSFWSGASAIAALGARHMTEQSVNRNLGLYFSKMQAQKAFSSAIITFFATESRCIRFRLPRRLKRPQYMLLFLGALQPGPLTVTAGLAAGASAGSC